MRIISEAFLERMMKKEKAVTCWFQVNASPTGCRALSPVLGEVVRDAAKGASKEGLLMAANKLGGFSTLQPRNGALSTLFNEGFTWSC